MSNPNPAESVSALIEYYKNVGFQDDGMRPYDSLLAPYGCKSDIIGGLTGFGYSSNGDIGIINTGTGSNSIFVSYKRDCNYRVFGSSTYTTAIVRGRSSTSNANWACFAYQNAMSLGNTGWLNNTIFETHAFALAAGNHIDSLNLLCQTTNGQNAKCEIDYIMIAGGGPFTLTPSQVNIDNVITDGFDTASITMSYPDVITNLPDVNDHTKIWLSKGSSVDFHKAFTGKLSNINKKSKGKEHRWIELEANGYGKYLTERKFYGSRYGLANSVMVSIMGSLINEGLLTAYNVQSSGQTINVKADDSTPIIDIIRNDIISASDGNLLDWDFYVDMGSDVHAFQTGYYPIGGASINLANDMFNFEYEKNSDMLINKQEILGAYGKGWGDASTISGTMNFWTEGLNGWSNAYGVLSLDSPSGTLGTHCIKCYSDNSNGIPMWLEKTIPTLDISNGGDLNFQLFYKIQDWFNATISSTINVTAYLFSSTNDYFVTSWIKGGGDEHIPKGIVTFTGPDPGDTLRKYWTWNWSPVSYPLGIRNASEWVKIGDPSWKNINKIRIEVNDPLTFNGYFFPLDMRIDEFGVQAYFYGIYEDTISQQIYGIQEGEGISQRLLMSDNECTMAASLIVSSYANPLENISGLSTSKKFDIELGYEYIFNTLDINCTLGVRKISHQLNNFELNTDLELAHRYIPTPAIMMAKFNRQLNVLNRDTYLWKDITSGKMLTPGNGQLVDWWDMDPNTNIYSWTPNQLFIFNGSETANIYHYHGDGTSKYSITTYEYKLYSGSVANVSTEFMECPFNNTWNNMFPIDRSRTISVGSDFRVSSVTNVEAIIYTGTSWGGGYWTPATITAGFGFQVDNNTLSGISFSDISNHSKVTLRDGDIYANNIYKLGANYYPDDHIDFYVNGMWRGSINTNLPSSNMGYYAFKVKPLASNSERTLTITNYRIGVL